MELALIVLGVTGLAILSFFCGFFVHYYWQRRLDISSLEKARKELNKIKRTREFDFFPGTIQYRPVVSAYTTNAIDRIFIWNTDTDFGIGGAYTRDGKFTIDEFPLVLNHADVEPESFVELGKAISGFGEDLKFREASNA